MVEKKPQQDAHSQANMDKSSEARFNDLNKLELKQNRQFNTYQEKKTLFSI